MKQRPRRVGLGMKPREVSAGVVQPEVPKEAVSEVVVGEPEGDHLDLKAEPVIDLEFAEVGEEVEKETTVAEMQVLDLIPAVPQEAFDTLAALMANSKDLTGVLPEVDSVTVYRNTPEGYVPIPGGVDVGAIQKAWVDVTFPKPPGQYAIGADYGSGEDKGAAAIIRLGENGAADELVAMLGLKPIGPLPNGEYRATVRLPEGYVEGIKAQAEADNQSLEDWLSFQLQERLEQWFFAAGAK